MMSPLKQRPYLLRGFFISLIALAIMGLSPTLAKFYYNSGGEIILYLIIRNTIISLGLLGWAKAAGQPFHLTARQKRYLPWSILFGLMTYGGYFMAIHYISVSATVILFYTYAAMTAGLVLFSPSAERAGWIHILTIVLTTIGVIIFNLSAEATVIESWIGIGFALTGALGMALMSVLSEEIYTDADNPHIFRSLSDFGLVVILGLLFLWHRPVAGDPSIAVLAGFLHTVAIVALVYTFRYIGAIRFGIVSAAEPLFGVALAFWLLGEGLSLLQYIGGAFIIGAVFGSSLWEYYHNKQSAVKNDLLEEKE